MTADRPAHTLVRMVDITAMVWIIALGFSVASRPGTVQGVPLVRDPAPTSQVKKAVVQERGPAERDDFWLQQIDKYGIVGPMLLALLLWILGLLVVVAQAWSAVRERSRVAAENERANNLLHELAEQLVNVATPRSGAPERIR